MNLYMVMLMNGHALKVESDNVVEDEDGITLYQGEEKKLVIRSGCYMGYMLLPPATKNPPIVDITSGREIN